MGTQTTRRVQAPGGTCAWREASPCTTKPGGTVEWVKYLDGVSYKIPSSREEVVKNGSEMKGTEVLVVLCLPSTGGANDEFGRRLLLPNSYLDVPHECPVSDVVPAQLFKPNS